MVKQGDLLSKYSSVKSVVCDCSVAKSCFMENCEHRGQIKKDLMQMMAVGLLTHRILITTITIGLEL